MCPAVSSNARFNLGKQGQAVLHDLSCVNSQAYWQAQPSHLMPERRTWLSSGQSDKHQSTLAPPVLYTQILKCAPASMTSIKTRYGAQRLTRTKGYPSNGWRTLTKFLSLCATESASPRKWKTEMETDQSELLGHLCLLMKPLWDNANVSFEHKHTHCLLYLSHTHTRMIQFSDIVIICWWGTASPAQWGGVRPQ